MTGKYCGLLAATVGVAALLYAPPALAQSYLGGNLIPFGVLGGSAVTCTVGSVQGDVGTWPSASITGFPTCTKTGALHNGDLTAQNAQSDLTIAFGTLAGQPCGLDLSTKDLGGLTLIPGTYCFSSSAGLTGTLTLNGNGNPSAVWVFQVSSALTTAGNVVITNGGNPCSVQWKVGTATLNNSQIAGNILAQTSITLNNSTLAGRALARTGAVTMSGSSNTVTTCGQGGGGGSSGGGSGGAPGPFPGAVGAIPTLPLLALGLLAAALAAAGLALLRRRRLTPA